MKEGLTEHQRENGYYLINGKRVLYWQDGEWWEAVKYMNRYTGNIRKMDKQPKIIKSEEPYSVDL